MRRYIPWRKNAQCKGTDVTTIHLVMGEGKTNDYDMRWPVKAFTSHKAALKFSIDAQRKADELWNQYWDFIHSDDGADDWVGESEFDANCDGTDEITYWVTEILFDESEN